MFRSKIQTLCTLLAIYVFLHISSCNTKENYPNPEVRIDNGIPTLFIDGERYPPFAYLSYLGDKKYYKEFADIGIHLYNFPVYLGDRGINSNSGIKPFRKNIWVGENEYDYTSIINDFDAILEADPNAKVILRIHLDPPMWWEEKNPDVVCLLPDGNSFRTSFFSSKWQQEAGVVLEDCISWLLKSQYAKHFVGVHLAAGDTEEWFYHYNRYFFDENPERLIKFRNWLKHKYDNNNDALCQAWNNPDANFETAQISDISGNNAKNEWRKSANDRQTLDYFDFHAENLVDHIIYFSKIVKGVSNKRLLAGAFNGYHLFVSDPRRGHGALAKLLTCNDIDFLSSPNDYNRVAGEDWPPMLAIQSVQKHGKLWLAENDTRTTVSTLLRERAPHIAPDNSHYDGGVWKGPSEIETSVSFLWKNLARMYAYGYGGWWFDMWGGWFSHPELLTVLKKGQDLFYEFPDKEVPQMKPEVCVIADEKLLFWDASYGSLTNRIISNRYALAKTGAPYDLFLRSDLNSINTDRYKVIWFMGTPEITVEENRLIEDLAKKGLTIIVTDTEGSKIYKSQEEVQIKPTQYQFSAEELSSLYKTAGVHQYINTQDVLYAGRGWVGIHSKEGGKKCIKLPLKAKVLDVINDIELANSSDSIEIDMAPQSTVLLKIID